MTFDLLSRVFHWANHLATPSSCLICHTWQAHRVCQPCMALFATSRLRCQRCGVAMRRLGHSIDQACICSQCQDYPPDLDQTIVAVNFEAPWSNLISQLKFRDTPAIAQTLGRLMAQAVQQQQLSAPDLIIPIPLSKQRWKERGYNQSWLLARHAAQVTGWENRLCSQTLARIKDTKRLMNMQADERQQHIRNAFEVNASLKHQVMGQHVVIVDDVMTTGATVNEAARTLYASGAATVTGWFLARTPAPHQKAKLHHLETPVLNSNA